MENAKNLENAELRVAPRGAAPADIADDKSIADDNTKTI